MLETQLNLTGDFVVSSAACASDAIQSVMEIKDVDVILMSFSAHTQDNLDELKKLVEAQTEVPVAVFSEGLSKSTTSHLMRMGVQGYIPRSFPVRSMVNALKFVAAGEIYVPASFLSDVAESASSPEIGLSRREYRVLQGLFHGKTNKEIGRELGLTEVTVKMHVRAICSKLEAKNRTHAAMIARHLNLEQVGEFVDNR